jgi:hypothetical protein
MAVAEFRGDSMTSELRAMTEFTVALHRPAVEHKIRLGQAAKWARGNMAEGPAGITKRQRVRNLLNNRNFFI